MNRGFRRTWLIAGLVLACEGSILPIEPIPQDLAPAWHPEGLQLAVQHEGVEQPSGVYLVGLNSSGRRLVMANGVSPDWRPDGTELVLAAGGQIFLVRLSTGTPIPLSNPEAWNGSPSWSPDGRWIAFSSNGGDNHSPPDLWLLDLESSLPARRVPLGGPPRNEMGEKDWSPASDRLVMSVAGSPQRLFVTDLTGQDTAYITGGNADAVMPAWHPGGEWIAYVRRTNTYGDCWLIRPDGSEDHRLVRQAVYPSWSPDGQRLAFSRPTNSTTAIWSVALDGSDLRQLTFP